MNEYKQLAILQNEMNVYKTNINNLLGFTKQQMFLTQHQ